MRVRRPGSHRKVEVVRGESDSLSDPSGLSELAALPEGGGVVVFDAPLGASISAVIPTKVGATALLKLSKVNFSTVPFPETGRLNQRTCRPFNRSSSRFGTAVDPGTSYFPI